MQNTLLIAALAAGLACGTACARTAAKPSPKTGPGYEHYIIGLEAIDKKFADLDTDHNSYIDSNEAKADPALARDYPGLARKNGVTRGVYFRWLHQQSVAAGHRHGKQPPTTAQSAP